MKIRWLGNAAVEIFGEKHILIDPNVETPPKEEADIVLLTHEHDDHFNREDYEKYGPNAETYGPRTALEKFDIKGVAVNPEDEIDEIKVLESDCWGTEESLSYFYHGVLHTGDSASFPTVKNVKVIFSACFPDYYKEYTNESKRLNPELVIPFHFDPVEDKSDATNLSTKLRKEGINSQILNIGASIEV